MTVPWIVMRAHNDLPVIVETLDMVCRQDMPFRLLVMDNASTDGTSEVVRAYANRVIQVPAGAYVPGRVLNDAMRSTDGDVVVFLNSDCTPADTGWLRRLIAPFDEPDVAAVFGRQMPRPECAHLFQKDTDDAYGDGRRQRAWRHCFSMASSAIRRSVWRAAPFDESLKYSEDVDWSYRAAQAGHRVLYQPESRVSHCHDYTLAQAYRRQRGEGEAEARIFSWSTWRASLVRYSLMPLARRLASDLAWCARRGHWRAALHAPVLRLAETLGRRAGFNAGRAVAS